MNEPSSVTVQPTVVDQLLICNRTFRNGVVALGVAAPEALTIDPLGAFRCLPYELM